MSHLRFSWNFTLAGNNDCMVPPDSSRARDAGLRKLVLAKRWLLAGSVTLTGGLTAILANAFPGRTIKSSDAGAANVGHSSKASSKASTPDRHTQSSPGSSGSLQPPAQAPQSTTPQESAPAHESTPAQEPAPAQESTPAHETAPAQESPPAKESAPAPEPVPVEHSEPAQPAPEAPVVSGGS
jgi:outer membrane biosynthesis protein TonB